jgi:hypothetical protein
MMEHGYMATMKKPAKAPEVAPMDGLRAEHLQEVIDRLNAWAKAPCDGYLTSVLKQALGRYTRGVGVKDYPAMDYAFCAVTAKGKQSSVIPEGCMRSFGFTAEVSALPWE